MAEYTYQDFSLINSGVQKIAREMGQTNVNAFYFYVLGLLFDYPEDEIEDAITDNNYLIPTGRGGHDRGIDAVIIDEQLDPRNEPVIHIFNFKFTSNFEKSKK